MTLEGKAAVVTGGGRGIGKCIAMRLASEGASVCVLGPVDHDVQTAERDISAMGRSAVAVIEPLLLLIALLALILILPPSPRLVEKAPIVPRLLRFNALAMMLISPASPVACSTKSK